MSLDINMGKWNALPKHLQQLVEAVVKEHSWDHYTAIQKADIEAFDLFKKQGVEVIRLKEEDIEKFKKFAPASLGAVGQEAPPGFEGLQVPVGVHQIGEDGLFLRSGSGGSRREETDSLRTTAGEGKRAWI
jgi:hypothetical protein